MANSVEDKENAVANKRKAMKDNKENTPAFKKMRDKNGPPSRPKFRAVIPKQKEKQKEREKGWCMSSKKAKEKPSPCFTSVGRHKDKKSKENEEVSSFFHSDPSSSKKVKEKPSPCFTSVGRHNNKKSKENEEVDHFFQSDPSSLASIMETQGDRNSVRSKRFSTTYRGPHQKAPAANKRLSTTMKTARPSHRLSLSGTQNYARKTIASAIKSKNAPSLVVQRSRRLTMPANPTIGVVDPKLQIRGRAATLTTPTTSPTNASTETTPTTSPTNASKCPDQAVLTEYPVEITEIPSEVKPDTTHQTSTATAQQAPISPQASSKAEPATTQQVPATTQQVPIASSQVRPATTQQVSRAPAPSANLATTPQLSIQTNSPANLTIPSPSMTPSNSGDPFNINTQVFELVETITTLSSELQHRTAHYEAELQKANNIICMLRAALTEKDRKIALLAQQNSQPSKVSIPS